MTIEDELELPWQGESRAATVLAIHKGLDRRMEGQRQPSPPVAEAEVSVTQTVAAAPAGAALEVEVGDTVTYRTVGSALLGLSVGDDAEVTLPEGTWTLVVLELEKGSGLQGDLSRDNVIPLSNPRQTRAPALPAATPSSARAPERWPTSAGRLQVDGSHAFRVDQEPSPGRTFPYVNWQRRPLPDPRTAPLATVVQGLKEIADAEGPMLAQRTYQLYARAAGLDRVGRIIRSRLDEVLQAALAQGLLAAEYEHDERETILAIIRPPQAPPVIVRTLGDRSFGEIPPSEIGEVMRCLIGKKRGIDREQLHRGVLQHYGLIRMTNQVIKELERIYMRFVYEKGCD